MILPGSLRYLASLLTLLQLVLVSPNSAASEAAAWLAHTTQTNSHSPRLTPPATRQPRAHLASKDASPCNQVYGPGKGSWRCKAAGMGSEGVKIQWLGDSHI